MRWWHSSKSSSWITANKLLLPWLLPFRLRRLLLVEVWGIICSLWGRLQARLGAEIKYFCTLSNFTPKSKALQELVINTDIKGFTQKTDIFRAKNTRRSHSIVWHQRFFPLLFKLPSFPSDWFYVHHNLSIVVVIFCFVVLVYCVAFWFLLMPPCVFLLHAFSFPLLGLLCRGRRGRKQRAAPQTAPHSPPPLSPPLSHLRLSLQHPSHPSWWTPS